MQVSHHPIYTLVTFLELLRLVNSYVQLIQIVGIGHFLVSDVDMASHSVTLTVHHSKAHLRGKGQKGVLYQSSDIQIWPVRAPSLWLHALDSRVRSFFQHEDGLPLTQYLFSAVKHKVLILAGLDVTCKAPIPFRSVQSQWWLCWVLVCMTFSIWADGSPVCTRFMSGSNNHCSLHFFQDVVLEQPHPRCWFADTQ